MLKTRSGHEEGAVFPVFLVAIVVVFAMAVVLLHVGRAGDLRTRAQTAADAAALGAVAEIRDEALQSIVQAFLPYATYNPFLTPDAAREYASNNGAAVSSIDYAGFLGHTVTVHVKTKDTVGGIFKSFTGGRGTAKAIATVDFPNCTLVFGPWRHKHRPPPLLGTSCDGFFVPIGARPSAFIRLFRVHLVAKAPPKFPLYTGPVGGGPVNVGPSINLCAKVASQAGFTGQSLIVAVAIAMAESSCNPNATNANSNGSVDYGLWQINTVHGIPTSCLFDPLCNAQQAYRISSGGTNFYPWCTYEPPACGGAAHGQYRQYLSAAEAAVARLHKGGGG